MAISEKDLMFMTEVARYYLDSASGDSDGSIRDTAIHFNISRNKVRKILITTGVMESTLTEDALRLQAQGLSIKAISKALGVSVATVSTAIPYGDKIDNSLDPTSHAAEVRGYRAYEKAQKKRQAGEAPDRSTWSDMDRMKEVLDAELKEESPERYEAFMDAAAELDREKKEEELELTLLQGKDKLSDEEKKRLTELEYKYGFFLGALNDRNMKVLEEVAGDRLPPEPVKVLWLHMELYSDYEYDEDTEALKKYGKLKYGDHISRDIVVPSDIPLYAMHYMIQRAFGWENSHLHEFTMSEERFADLCNDNAAMWSTLVGVLFRSPLMNEEDEFWADDYNEGSFKNWLRSKYTGPYLSLCHGEGLIACQDKMMELDMDAEYYVAYDREYNHETGKYDGEEYVTDVRSVYDYKGNKTEPPKPWHEVSDSYRVETRKFAEVPATGLKYLFERATDAVLERLPISSVLAVGKYGLTGSCTDEDKVFIEEQLVDNGNEIFGYAKKHVHRIIEDFIDSPEIQVPVMPFTDELLYKYDFGDGWKIRITASENCPDLVESGRITQKALDKANVKCRNLYRPVLIARNGEMLVDDVGGISGFADFLRNINPVLTGLTPEEREDAEREKAECLEWAQSLGWHRERLTDYNLL